MLQWWRRRKLRRAVGVVADALHRRQAELEDELERESFQSTRELAESYIRMMDTAKFKPEVELDAIIGLFAKTHHVLLSRKRPRLFTDGGDLYLLMVMTAIKATALHSDAEVLAAFNALEERGWREELRSLPP